MLRFWIGGVIVFAILDIAVFRWFLWTLPNQSAFDTSPHYNFLYNAQKLPTKKVDEYRVVILGSSIGIYSIRQDLLQEIFKREQSKREDSKNVSVYFLAHQGMNPLNLYAAYDTIHESDADQYILLTNMVDFRVERVLVLGLEESLANPGSRANALDTLGEDLAQVSELNLLSPSCFECPGRLPDRMERFANFLFASYRFSKIFKNEATQLLQNRFSKGKSYLNYAGIPISKGGVSRRGWTSREFSFVVTSSLQKELFFQAAQSGEIRLNICNQNPPSSKTKGANAKVNAGWQSFSTSFEVGDEVCVSVKDTLYSEEFDDFLGVRLPRNFGLSDIQNKAYRREIRREDVMFRDFSESEYRDSFRKRVQGFDRSGMEYIRYLELLKRKLDKQGVDKELPAFVFFEKFRRKMSRDHHRLLIVNAAENPISLDWYKTSDWYSEWLDLLRPRTSNETFTDMGNLLPMQYFYDTHHLTYFGATVVTKKVGMIIINEK